MRSLSYRGYLLSLLLLILAFNGVDRLALGIVLQDIKADLGVSDAQLGLLTGMAFALFYAVMGIPIARWADRGNRVTIIASTTLLWSIAVALCGLAVSFIQLLAIRICVAVGEAGCLPPAHSLIADSFDRAERPRAVSRYMLGGPLSVVIGFFCAGWLNEFYGWRTTFTVLGAPGVALALLAWFTLREPRRAIGRPGAGHAPSRMGGEDGVHEPVAFAGPGLWEVCATLSANATFRHLLFCYAVAAFFGAGIGQWLPAFFIRSYGLGTGELGTWFALISGLGGVLGTYLGGELASRRASQNESLQLVAMAFAYLASTIAMVALFSAASYSVSLAWLGLTAVVGAMATGPLFALIQTLVPSGMRATAIAFIFLVSNLVGMGMGPVAVGMLSDVLKPLLGEESLRYALLAMCPGYLWSAWHVWRASKTVGNDLSSSPQLTASPNAKRYPSN